MTPTLRQAGRSVAIGIARSPLHDLIRRGTLSGRLPARGLRSGPIRRQPFYVRIDAECGFWYQPMSATDHLAHPLYWEGLRGYEAATVALFVDKARRARTFVDAGAATGLFCLVACAVNPSLHIHAFEPVPATAAALRRNVEINGFNVAIHNVGLSDRSGSCSFVTSADHPEINHIPRKGVQYDETKWQWQHATVPMVTLDEALDEAPVDLMKLDVECHEAAVLRGARATLGRHKPTLFLEVLPWATESPQGILDAEGYRYVQISDEGLSPTDSLASVSAADSERNFLCRAG